MVKGNKNKRNEGITLVALIITIIVLIILAAVTINAVFDLNILDVAQKQDKNMQKANIKKKKNLIN